MSRTLGPAALLLLPALLVLAWSAREASALRADAPVLVRRGAAIDEQASAPDASGAEELALDPSAVLTVADLAFDDYDPPELRPADPDPLGPDVFPPAIAALDGLEVTLRGFPIVVTLDADQRVEGFALSRFPPGCCFGALPVPDEWVDVVAADDAGFGDLVPVAPVDVRGVLEVGEVQDERGHAESLYRLTAARPVDDG